MNKPNSLKDTIFQFMGPGPMAFKSWLKTLSLREQILVKTLSLILILYVVWSLTVLPALNSLNKSALKSQIIQRQWSELTALQNEIKTIKSLSPISQAEAGSALQEMAAQLCTQCKVVIQDSTARMQIKGVSPENLAQLFPQIRTRSQSQILEASLKLDSQSKLWEGSITLGLPNSNNTY